LRLLRGQQIAATRSQEAGGGEVRFGMGRSFIEVFGHEVAVMVEEAAAAVEFDGGVAVGDLEVKEFGLVFAGSGFGEIEKLGANSLSAVGGFDEEFVNPRAFAAIFEAVVETNHEISDRRIFFPNKIDDAVGRILQKLGEGSADRGLVEGLGPRIGLLHEAHDR